MRWKVAIALFWVVGLLLCSPAGAQSPDENSTNELNTISAFAVEERSDGTYIRIHGSKVPTFSVFQLNEPLRLFVDISNSKLIDQAAKKDIQNGVISSVSLIEFEDSFQSVARLIIGFDTPAHYDMKTDGNDVVVFVDGAQRSNTVQQALAQNKYEEERRQKEQELAQAQAKIKALEQRYERDIERVQSTYSNAESELAQARLELTQLRQEKQAIEQSFDGVSSKVQMTQAQLQEQRDKLVRAQQREQQLASQVDELKLELERTKAQQAEIAQAKAQLPPAKAQAVEPSEDNTVRGIRLEVSDDGRSRIVVELDRPGQFETQNAGHNRSVMILNNVSLPKHLEQTLSADAQGGAVRFVSSFNEDTSGTVKMEAELRSDSSQTVRQQGNELVWEFAPTMEQSASFSPRASEQNPQAPTAGQSFSSAPPNYPATVIDPSQVNHVPGMSNRRIGIDLRNADIQNVLRLFAKEGGVNIIAGQGVSGTVTMNISGVPIDQAFLTILQSLQLGFEVRNNVIRVAPQSVLTAEEAARAEARTREQRQQPLEVFLLPINYATASELVPQVEGLLSPRGSVSVDSRTNTLIIKDLRENLQSMRLLIESLDSQVPQVLIEARIVETNDVFARQIGIQWGGDMAFSQGNGNPTGLIFPSIIGLGGGATDGQAPTTGTASNPNFAVNLPAPAGTGAGGAIGLTMGSVGGAVNLNLRLSAMEEAGYAKIVTAPKIMTLDNREASISQGTSIPISVVGAAGVQTQFVDATLELTVTPHVTPDGNVQMRINAMKNEPDFQNTGARGDPTIIRRQAQTELLVKDGDTTVIGGIYTRNAGMSVAAVPFFHRIPILGFFFRTTSQSERRSELLIFITPRIVNRAESLGVLSAGSVTGDFGAASAE